MQRRRLPGTDLELSLVGLGCWPFGGKYWGDDWSDADSVATIERAVELGINWFDTAPLYGDGKADELLVETLGARRHGVVIVTKVGARTDPEAGHAVSDLSPENVRRDCEASLRRLGLERLPLLQAHWPCQSETPLEATLEALETLRGEGKIGAVGLCNYDAPTLKRAVELAPIVSLQTPYSMVRREFEAELVGVCAADPGSPRVGVLAYETLCRGLLTGKFGEAPPEFPDSDLRTVDDRFRGRPYRTVYRLNRALAVVARRASVPHAALGPGWVLSRPGVTAVIVGAKRPDQIEETSRAAELAGRAQLWKALQRYIDATHV